MTEANNLDDPNEAVRANLDTAWEHVRAAGRRVADSFPLVNIDNRWAFADVVANMLTLEEVLERLARSEGVEK